MTIAPLLFLDVDGPLIPFGASGGAHPTYPPAPPASVSPLLARLDPAQGPRLAALPYALVWATTWQEDANSWIAPRLGLPALPLVRWPDEEPAPAAGRHWKTAALVAYAAGRPFAWVDDEMGAADHEWVAAHHPGRALLHRVDPCRGLTATDYETLTAWAGLPAGPA
ncbi:HAD domain-containing protein [Streptomyces sp. c-19]|uniref:HAD domain-containing protein n=1 Tax=Streptomyces sp. c-19 TaxID=2789275 RepID=UPI00397F4A0C